MGLQSAVFPDGKTLHRSIPSDGQTREYILYLPESYDGKTEVPLIMVFHGGGGNSQQAMEYHQWNPLADRHGFIVCYPNAIDKHWNDGRDSTVFREQDSKVDDVAFVKKLLDNLYSEYRIDTNRVFSSGASNGGMFSQRLAIDCADRFAAIAPLISSIPEAMASRFQPCRPVSVLMINGTADPFVPYQGGDVRVTMFPVLAKLKTPKSRGKVIPTDDAIRFWLKHDKLAGEPKVEALPDTDPNDGTTAIRKTWSDPDRKISVVLITVVGGGHTCPGLDQYLPERIIGKTSRDFDSTEAIWAFFSTHGRITDKGIPAIGK